VRVSRSVLREAGGAIPPAYSPTAGGQQHLESTGAAPTRSPLDDRYHKITYSSETLDGLVRAQHHGFGKLFFLVCRLRKPLIMQMPTVRIVSNSIGLGPSLEALGAVSAYLPFVVLRPRMCRNPPAFPLVSLITARHIDCDCPRPNP
jgi:hypothetical protein